MSDAASTTLPNTGAARLTARRDGASLALTFGGAWTLRSVAEQDQQLRDLDPADFRRAAMRLGDLTGLDTAGAWVIYRTARQLEKAGLEVVLEEGTDTTHDLIDTVGSHHVTCPPPPKPENPVVAMLLRLGEGTFQVCGELRDLVAFLGLTVIVIFRSLLRPGRIRFTSLVSHMEQAGLNALPIVGLISFLVGVVLAYQGADQLARFGAQIFTVNLVAVGVLREMGILLTAIIVAGRSGSAYTAQIGTMKVNEEVDALRAIGLDPMEVLVMPRVIGLVLVMPLLTFYADIMGVLGGAVMATLTLDISLFQFARQFNDAVSLSTFWVGMVKAPLFAFVIALVGCYEGLQVSRNAESVGRQTTRAVVEAIFLVIVFDALLSILFSILGI